MTTDSHIILRDKSQAEVKSPRWMLQKAWTSKPELCTGSLSLTPQQSGNHPQCRGLFFFFFIFFFSLCAAPTASHERTRYLIFGTNQTDGKGMRDKPGLAHFAELRGHLLPGPLQLQRGSQSIITLHKLLSRQGVQNKELLDT